MSDYSTDEAGAGAYADRPARRVGGALVRLMLPVAALAMVGAVFFFASRGSVDAPAGLSVEGVTIGNGLEVTKPRFFGETEDGQPFQVTAARAQPDGPDPKRIKLFEVEGEVGLPGGETLSTKAANGLFKPKENDLSLEGGVVARTSDGYTLTSETIRFDLKARSGETETPVRIEGPMGELDADRMKAVFDKDLVADFTGGVKITIRQLVERSDR